MAKARSAGSDRAFYFNPLNGQQGEHVKKYTEILKEVRIMWKEIPTMRFWGVWLLGLLYLATKLLGTPVIVSWFGR